MTGRVLGRALALTILIGAASVARAADVLLLSGQRHAEAELLACEINSGTTRVTLSVKGMTVSADERLVRWGEPAALARRPGLVLADGSWLLSDRAWSPLGLLRLNEEQAQLRRGRSSASFPRAAVRWAVLDAEGAGLTIDTAPLDPPEEDEILVAGGDRLDGKVLALTGDKLRSSLGDDPIDTPVDRVMALRFAGGPDPSRPAVLVGLAGGSLLRAESLAVSEGVARIGLLGAEFETPASTVTLVQPLNTGVRYVSDLEPVDYRHTPYLDLVWPYARDRGLRGAALAGGGARRAKGLAMHSAARLVYRHDGSAAHFRADLAVADPPLGSEAEGSVTFRVYRVTGGAFEPAYKSPVTRSGDAPSPIEVDLEGSAALVLVVDYADDGDAGDHGLWLDARIEPRAI